MPADNPHAVHEVLPPGPARRAAAVTPHDTNELPFVSRFLYVGGTGSVVVVTEYGDEVTFAGVPAGAVLPIAAKIVKTTSTATNIVAMS